MNRSVAHIAGVLSAAGMLLFFPAFFVNHGAPDLAMAAEPLKIDGLPKESQPFRAQVNQILAKVDSLINKLKADPKNRAIVLDLIQTRDDILREIVKIEAAPGDAKWTAREMRESVEAKLKLLKEQYDKAAGMV
jgi:hypothetical protein